jgi:hypothetical protein
MIRPAMPCEQKIMIARGDVKLGHGRHHIRYPDGGLDYAATGAAQRVEDLGRGWDGDCFHVHHFRWTSRLCRLLDRTVSHPEYHPNYVDEVQCLKKLRCEANTLFFHQHFLWTPDEDMRPAGGLPPQGLSYSS